MNVKEIHWEITNACNLNCKHCLSSSGAVRSKELTTEEAYRAINVFLDSGVSKIYFTGGEPFFRKDFLNILERVIALGIKVAIITNTTILQEEILTMIKKMDIELGISLEGADKEINDLIRGVGSFENIIRVLEFCQKLNIKTSLYTTINAINIDQITKIAEISKKYGCEHVHFNEITFGGRALDFSNELLLSERQKDQALELVNVATSKVFGEQLVEKDDGCWVDTKTLFMSSDGNLYVCSEIFQRQSEFTIGNIRSIALKSWAENYFLTYVQKSERCCYGVLRSKHVVFVYNTKSSCVLVSQKQEIKTLSQLYDIFEDVSKNIECDCKECSDADCMGYIWLLKREADRLFEKGVPIVQINDGPNFIHSFPVNEQGALILSVRYPPCSQLCTSSKRCNIYKERPLVCRIYPLGLETKEDGTVIWVLHKDCLHVRKLEERGLLLYFEQRLKNIINNISVLLLKEIVEAYCAVDRISIFPNGENSYIFLQEVKNVKV